MTHTRLRNTASCGSELIRGVATPAKIFTTRPNLPLISAVCRATSHGNDIWRKLKSDRPTAHSKLRIALDRPGASERLHFSCMYRMHVPMRTLPC